MNIQEIKKLFDIAETQYEFTTVRKEENYNEVTQMWTDELKNYFYSDVLEAFRKVAKFRKTMPPIGYVLSELSDKQIKSEEKKEERITNPDLRANKEKGINFLIACNLLNTNDVERDRELRNKFYYKLPIDKKLSLRFKIKDAYREFIRQFPDICIYNDWLENYIACYEYGGFSEIRNEILN